MCERTDSHVTAKYFEIDGLPNFVRYGAPLMRFRCVKAPLVLCVLKGNFCIQNVLISFSHWALSKHNMTCVHFRTRDPNKRLNCLIFRQKIKQTMKNSLVNIRSWVIAIKYYWSAEFRIYLLPLSSCDFLYQCAVIEKPNFTKVFRVFGDIKNFILSSTWFGNGFWKKK